MKVLFFKNVILSLLVCMLYSSYSLADTKQGIQEGFDLPKSITNHSGKINSNTRLNSFNPNIPRYRVHVLGNVISPGVYEVSPSDRVYDAIGYAGGVSPSGTIRDIQLKRGKNKENLDLFGYINNAELEENPFLVENDVVFVPVNRGMVEIQGPVKKPGEYEFIKNLKIDKLIDIAGGFTSGIDKSKPLTIIRYSDNNEKKLINVDIQDIRKAKVQVGDVVFLPHILIQENSFDYKINKIPGDNIFYPSLNNNIYVVGEVSKPGPIQFRPNLTSLDYISLAGPMSTSNIKRSKVILKDGRKFLAKNVEIINPGDTIIVPAKSFTFDKALTVLSTIASTTLSTVLVYDSVND